HYLPGAPWGIQAIDAHLSDHVFWRVAEDPRGRAVEEEHGPAQIRGDDAVYGAVDHALQELLRLLELDGGLTLAGYIAEREQDRVVLVQHRARAHADHRVLATT